MSEKPSLPSNTPRGPDRPGVPLRGISQNYINAQAQSAVTSPTSPTVKIPDGRRTSTGEAITSPTETWRPNYERKQSWNQEDLKRQLMMSGIEKVAGTEVRGTGFTEAKSEGK